MGPRGRRRSAHGSTDVEREVAPSVLGAAHGSARRRGAKHDLSAIKGRPPKGGQAPLKGRKDHESRSRRAIPDTHGRNSSVAGEAPTEPATFDHPYGSGVLLCQPQTKYVMVNLVRSWLLFQ